MSLTTESVDSSSKTPQNSFLIPHQLGSNKLKSHLRQANRLLKKEGLSEQVRKSTESQIQLLQHALENTTNKDQEKANAVRYHRIKFFDRKKILRRLKQVTRQLHTIDKSVQQDSKDSPHKQKKHLKRELECLRIDLHYVNVYPKHLKYVSLFPNGIYAKPSKLPSQLPNVIPSTKDPDALRDYVRAFMAESIKNGTLSPQPEVLKKTTEIDQGNAEQPALEDEVVIRNAQQKEELARDGFFATS